MKKKVLAIIMILALTAGACMTAFAQEKSSATKNSLQSSGRINYFEGEDGVVIDSADLYMLADQLDLFKVRVTRQLGAMHTYLTKAGGGIALTSADGVYAVHSRPYAGDEIDPVNLDFATILEGIAVSQSIPNDPAAYGMSAGTKLYKTPEGKLVTSSLGGAEPVNIQSASAANLSAGTAAWVNGKLVLGTGEDVARMAESSSGSSGGSGGTGGSGDSGDSGGSGSGGTGNVGQMIGYDITKGYTIPEYLPRALAYVVTTSSDGNNGGSNPVFEISSSGLCKRLFTKKYARNGFNVRVSLYYVENVPAGTVVKGSNGLLYY